VESPIAYLSGIEKEGNDHNGRRGLKFKVTIQVPAGWG